MALVNVTVCNMSVIRIVSVKVTVFPHTRPFHSFHVPLYVPMYQSIVMVSVSVAVTSPISGLSLYLVLVTATKLSTCTSISFDVQAMGSFICMGTQKEVNNNVQQAFKAMYHFKYFTPPWVASDCSCLNFGAVSLAPPYSFVFAEVERLHTEKAPGLPFHRNLYRRSILT